MAEKANLHFTKIIKDKNTFYHSDLSEICDGNLITEDGYHFRVHKVLLVNKSSYFSRIFCGEMGRERKDFLIPGIRGEILTIVLSYIYEGPVHLSKEIVRELIEAADYLLLMDLIKFIVNAYARDITLMNCLPFYLAGLQINCGDIIEVSARFIQMHFEAVINADLKIFAELPMENLKQFLGSKNLRVKDEDVVMTAIAKWIEGDVTHRQCFVPDLLMCLSLPDVDEKLANKILAHDIVVRNPHCAELNELKLSDLSMYDIFCQMFGYLNFHKQSVSPMFNSIFDWMRYLNINALHKYFPNLSILSTNYISEYLGYTNLIVLRNYFRMHPKPTPVSLSSRLPEHLWFIVQPSYQKPGKKHCVVYASYDEKLDLWRKIVEVNYRPEMIVCVEHYVYMFFERITERISCFDLLEKEWSVLPDFRASTKAYHQFVRLNGLIYIFDDMGSTVDVFDPYEDHCYSISLMRTLWNMMAVKLGDRIYVVGRSSTSTMIAQRYDSQSESWVILPAPSVFRYYFELVTYRGRLYVIGGRNEDQFLRSVEVFDPEKEEWEIHEDLPHIFYSPKAIVLHDELIVYDVNKYYTQECYCETNPAVLWDDELGLWKTVDKSSPKNILKNYGLFIQETEGYVHEILKTGKDPETRFEKSPFQ